MLVESDESCIYFEARPKREERPNVYKVILEIMGIFTVLYDGKANCIMHPEENSRGMWTVMMKFESDEYKNLLAQDKRFQELITDLRAYCKPAHRRRKLYTFLHPGKYLGVILSYPVGPINNHQKDR